MAVKRSHYTPIVKTELKQTDAISRWTCIFLFLQKKSWGARQRETKLNSQNMFNTSA